MRRGRFAVAWAPFALTIALALVWVVGVARGLQAGELQFLVPTLGGSLLILLLVRCQSENRPRVLKVVDRRFNRSHEGWVGVVSETMQPSLVAIWVREGK